jgi:hypothetical protein
MFPCGVFFKEFKVGFMVPTALVGNGFALILSSAAAEEYVNTLYFLVDQRIFI